MKYWSLLMLAGLITACTGEKPVGDDDDDTTAGDDDDDTVGDDDDDDTVGDSGVVTTDSGTFAPEYIDPVAVGFEYDGVVRSNGNLEGYTVPGYGDFEPTMYLKFADLDLFYPGGDELTDVCYAIGQYQPPPGANLVTHDGAALFSAYESALTFEYTTCIGVADPAIWGPNAEYLLTPFYGAHFGYGFGLITDYLISAFGTTTPLEPEFQNSLFAGYIAINDAAGDWIAYDWTIQYAFQWDSATGEVAVDGKYLVREDVSGVVPPDGLPDIYVRSGSYWYQDFIYMDLGNLAD
jgi:hypothetical protein